MFALYAFGMAAPPTYDICGTLFGRAHIDACPTCVCSNSWEQCAIAHNPETADWFPFYYCLEAAGAVGATKLPTEK